MVIVLIWDLIITCGTLGWARVGTITHTPLTTRVSVGLVKMKHHRSDQGRVVRAVSLRVGADSPHLSRDLLRHLAGFRRRT